MIRLIAVMAAFLVGLGVSLAPAQTASSPAVSPAKASATGAYARLSAGNQKIARALHAAQVGAVSEGSAPAPTPRTLDEIAAMKQGTGWGQVFKQLHAEGLIRQTTLGQVISSSNRAARATRGTLITTGTGRTYDMGTAIGYSALASVSDRGN